MDHSGYAESFPTVATSSGTPVGSGPSLASTHSYRVILFAFWAISAVSIGLIVASLISFRYVVASKEDVVDKLSNDVMELERLSLLAEKNIARTGSYLLTGSADYLKEIEKLRGDFKAQFTRVRGQINSAEGQRLLDQVAEAVAAHERAFAGISAYIAGRMDRTSAAQLWEKQILPARVRMENAFSRAISFERSQLSEGQIVSDRAQDWATRYLGAGAALTLLLSVGFGTVGLKTTRRLQRVEARIRENEAYFRTLADHAPAMVWVTDEHGFCTYVNRTWLEFTGRSLKDELGFGWLNSVHPEDAQDAYDSFLSSNRCKSICKLVYRLRDREGVYHWMLDTGAPRFDEQGNFLGYIGSAVDIEQQKQAEKRLEAALSARDEFMSIASHELRTPLTSLKLFLQMTQRNNSRTERLVAPGELLSFCDCSLKQVRSLERLVEDLLDVSRLRAGQLGIRPEQVRLADIVREVVNRHSEQSAQSGNLIELDLDEALEGHWDGYRIQQIVTNLLTNAIRHAPGTVITIQTRDSQGRAVLEVRDRGPGIPSEKLSKIFERYERVNRDRTSQSLGLGLFITRGLVQAHQGNIRVESGNGQGARFIVDLPFIVQGNRQPLTREAASA